MKKAVLSIIMTSMLFFMVGCDKQVAKSNMISTRMVSIDDKEMDKDTKALYNSIPKDSKIRSSIKKCDIDSDDKDETIIVYETKDGEMILAVFKQEEKEFKKVDDIEGKGQVVDWISFEDIDDDGIKEIIVSWSDKKGEEKEYSIYTLKDGKLKTSY